MFSKINKFDWVILVINFIAFLLQIWMPEGKTSVGTFVIFVVILTMVIIETIVVSGYVKSLILPFSKAILYFLAVIILLLKGATTNLITPVNIAMLSISLIGVSYRIYLKNYSKGEKKTLLWVQNIAGLPGSFAYFYAVASHPDDYGIYSFVFWVLQMFTYAVTCYYVSSNSEPKSSYIFPGFGFGICFVYLVVLLYYAIL